MMLLTLEVPVIWGWKGVWGPAVRAGGPPLPLCPPVGDRCGQPAGHGRALPRPLGTPSVVPGPSSAGCGNRYGASVAADWVDRGVHHSSRMGEPGGTPGAASGGTPGGPPAGGYSPATLAAKVSGRRAMARWEGGQWLSTARLWDSPARLGRSRAGLVAPSTAASCRRSV